VEPSRSGTAVSQYASNRADSASSRLERCTITQLSIAGTGAGSNGCRDRDLLIPPQYEVDSSTRHQFFLSGAGTTARLFRGGVEIPVDTSRGYPRFTLAAEPAIYRLGLASVRRGVPELRTLAPRTQTSSTFRSVRPAPGQLPPPEYWCRVSFTTGPCAFQPFIYLRYQLDLDLLNGRRPAGVTRSR
jgi:hypothetical protein